MKCNDSFIQQKYIINTSRMLFIFVFLSNLETLGRKKEMFIITEVYIRLEGGFREEGGLSSPIYATIIGV